MPRFFFHVYDDVIVLDDEGMILADEGAARAAALAGARALICDTVRKGRISLGHRIEVKDEAGATVVDLSFAEAVKIER
ncbi:MAG TPA: hypothetical protein VGB08_05990 [Allosphingosinicella sp.]|jgi:hypothetical protein